MKPQVKFSHIVAFVGLYLSFSTLSLATGFKHYVVFVCVDPPFISKARGTGTRVGQKGILQCEASAVPRADFEWYKEDRRWASFCGII